MAEISSALSEWSQSERLLRINTPLGQDKLLVESFTGIEDFVSGFKLSITVLSTDAYISLKSLISQPVLLELLTAHSRTELRPFHGYVTHAQNLGANGGFARYQLTVEPWSAYLAHRVDSTTYQDMTVMEIFESIFADYGAGSTLKSGTLNPLWRFDLADPSVYAKRSLTTQYQESDLAFVQRLMNEEGLFCWIEHVGDANSPSFGQHTLVIADHNEAFVPNVQADVEFTQSGTVMRQDGIDRWRDMSRWSANSIHQQSWDYRQINSRPVAAEADSAATHAEAPTLSLIQTPVAYAYENTAQGQRMVDRQLEARIAHRHYYIGAGTVRTMAVGTCFSLHGHASELDTQPVVVTRVVHQAYNNLSADLQSQIAHHLGLQSQHLEDDGIDSQAEQNVHAPQTVRYELKSDYKPQHYNLEHMHQMPSGMQTQQILGQRPLYRNRVECLLRATPYRNRMVGDSAEPLMPKPMVFGQQTAIVVGAMQHVLDTDRDHRIKVQFHWQRASEGSHRSHNRLQHPSAQGYTGAPSNEQAGTWVRVASNLAPIAGDNWGSVQVPRIGQEVVIDFIEGDIDRPLVVSTVYNGKGQDNAQYNTRAHGAGSSTGNASAWFPGSRGAHAHADVLSGLKTQSLSTSQSGLGHYNQLVMDDSPDQSRLSIQQRKSPSGSGQLSNELNLGYLRHQNDNQRLNPTGYGTELYSPQNVAVRAGQGILISTDKRSNATSSQLDSREAHNQIEQSHDLQVQLATTAQQHNAKLKKAKQAEPAPNKLPAIAAHAHTLNVISATGAGTSIQSAEANHHGGAGFVTAYSEPNIQLSSPAGISASTPKDVILSAGQTTSISAAQDINLATQGNQHHLVAQGISLFTYGKVDPTGSKRLPNKPNQETGIKLHAATGKVSLQSQSGKTNIESEKDLTVNSITQNINVGAPKHILMTAMGAAMKIEGGNITLNAPGNILFKASKKIWTTPASSSLSTTKFNISSLNTPQKYSAVLDAYDLFHRANLHQIEYAAKLANGEYVFGSLNEQGKTKRIFTPSTESFDVLVGSSGAWAVIGDDGDIRHNIGEAHHDEDEPT